MYKKQNKWQACASAAAATKEHPPDSKVHGANMGPVWGRQDPGGSHVGPMNFAIWNAGTERCYIRNALLHRPTPLTRNPRQ